METKFEFLPEHWNIIKKYAGIYHITTDWDLMRLDNREICEIVNFIPYPKLNFHSNEERVAYIWKNINKSKLYNIYSIYFKNITYSNDRIL